MRPGILLLDGQKIIGVAGAADSKNLVALPSWSRLTWGNLFPGMRWRPMVVVRLLFVEGCEVGVSQGGSVGRRGSSIV